MQPTPLCRNYVILALVLWLPALLLFFECCVRPITEPDLFFYFALVQDYLRTGHWPVIDPFLYTLPNEPLMSLHQWLGYWLFYIPYWAVGWAGPILLKTLLVLVFFVLPLISLWKTRRPIPVHFSLLWTLAIFTAHHRFRERVSLFGDLFTLLLISGLIGCAESGWFWLALPGLFLVWAQLHPSYPLGWVILIAYFISRLWPRRWTWVGLSVATQAPGTRSGLRIRKVELVSLLLCLLAPLINPLGLEGVLYPFQFTLNIEPYLHKYVVEWLPLTDTRLFSFWFLYIPFITLIPWTAWVLWRKRQFTSLFTWFLFALAIILNVRSVRFGLLAQGIYLALLAAASGSAAPDLDRSAGKYGVTTKYVTILALSLAVLALKLSMTTSRQLLAPLAKRFAISTDYFPESAATALERMHPRLHIFNSFGFGGYLSWRWGGNPKIFFHGFSTNFKFYEENYNQPQINQVELDRVVDRFDIGVFFLSKMGNDDNFINLLTKHPNWQKIREDGVSVIFAKRDPRVFP